MNQEPIKYFNYKSFSFNKKISSRYVYTSNILDNIIDYNKKKYKNISNKIYIIYNKNLFNKYFNILLNNFKSI